ncbi:MAG: matrixin family metalloprotease, partial [Actinomycetes bacterium]
TPVAFDPCRPLHYVVRPDGAPRGGAELLRWALGEVSAATGLQLVEDGPTDESPDASRAAFQPSRYGDRWAPVLVAWSSPAETSMLSDAVLGRAGPDQFATSEPGSERLVTGVAVFNGPAIVALVRGGDDSKARAVLLHELGHLVGLGHVTDPYQVMYDTNAYPLHSYRAGDLRGLEQLGQGPCFHDY